MINLSSDFDLIDFRSKYTQIPGNSKMDLLLSLIEKEKINSYFQPIVDLCEKRIFGFEMLARGEGFLFSPREMFEIAIDHSLEWELEYACRLAAIKKISALEPSFDKKTFFLNVSPGIFHRKEFQKGFTSNYIKEAGLKNNQIVLEITETSRIEDHDVFQTFIKHYVSQGFRVALDDFGAGHSGLATLISMTPHFIKIDKEITRGISKNRYKQYLLKSLNIFALEVGSSILAEGIETFEDLQMVHYLGVNFVQGYLLGPPQEEAQELTPHCFHLIDKLYRT